MKVYRDLEISIQQELTTDDFVREMENQLGSKWQRNVEQEREFAEHALGNEAKAFIFEYLETPKAGLFLFDDSSGPLRVTNIVPKETGKLSRDQYNGILSDFAKAAEKVKESGYAVVVSLGKEQEMLADYFAPEVVEKLERFSVAANKTTGRGHPLDNERWLGFVIAAHLNHAKGSEPLKTLLEEELDWPAEKAWDLASDFQDAIELLRAYDEYRGR